MLNLQNIKPGCRVTFVMSHNASAMDKKMNKGRGDNRNPLLGRVSRVVHIAGNAAGCETYANKLESQGEVAAGAPSAWENHPVLPCVVTLKSNPERMAVRIVNMARQSSALFVDGLPASPEHVTEFAKWKKSSNSENPSGYANLGIEHCVNVAPPEE